jgi:cell wall-associated NlpC family hydrolase
MLIAAMFGLTLAVNPISVPSADASVSPTVRARAYRAAAAQIGVRYTWGGTSRATGFDCSGLTQYAYARAGKRLPRTALQQYWATIHIQARRARIGDLVFFHDGRTVYHEGIYVGRGYIIHAPHSGARVRKAKLWTNRIRFGRVR